ncbi:MAG: carbamate kinase [Clostridia bacterium]|nr:carbamate kinase [Clostridia bacterium]
MSHKIVVAFGGKELQSARNIASAEDQIKVVKDLAEKLAEISARGYDLGIVHGNGPQVGRIMLASETSKDITPQMPFDVCGAMSQGYIGYHIQQALKYALNLRGINVPVVSVATQIIVDEKDPAFNNPTKPIGPHYTEEQANEYKEKLGYDIVNDAPGSFRRIVASPMPKKIVEIASIKQLWEKCVVICCGGGGIPVIENADGTYTGVEAVIDKDHSAELLAENVSAEVLIILTDVEKVSLNYGKENQVDLDKLNLKEASKYIEEGQFPAGNMLPKVEACMRFVRSNPTKKAIITSLDKVVDALDGKTGTVFSFA